MAEESVGERLETTFGGAAGQLRYETEGYRERPDIGDVKDVREIGVDVEDVRGIGVDVEDARGMGVDVEDIRGMGVDMEDVRGMGVDVGMRTIEGGENRSIYIVDQTQRHPLRSQVEGETSPVGRRTSDILHL